MTDEADPKRIPIVVTFLKMPQKPAALPPPQPGKCKIAVLKATYPPVHFYRYLYDTIGGPYKWVDRKKIDDHTLAAIIHDKAVELYVLYVDGSPAGMAELDLRKPGIAKLAYFGLIPDYIGRHLSYYFLYHCVSNAWSHPITELLVNTCSLDHARALPLYQRMGFIPYAREDRYVQMP